MVLRLCSAARDSLLVWSACMAHVSAGRGLELEVSSNTGSNSSGRLFGSIKISRLDSAGGGI